MSISEVRVPGKNMETERGRYRFAVMGRRHVSGTQNSFDKPYYLKKSGLVLRELIAWLLDAHLTKA